MSLHTREGLRSHLFSLHCIGRLDSEVSAASEGRSQWTRSSRDSRRELQAMDTRPFCCSSALDLKESWLLVKQQQTPVLRWRKCRKVFPAANTQGERMRELRESASYIYSKRHPKAQRLSQGPRGALGQRDDFPPTGGAIQRSSLTF